MPLASVIHAQEKREVRKEFFVAGCFKLTVPPALITDIKFHRENPVSCAESLRFVLDLRAAYEPRSSGGTAWRLP